jgi:hypothetical protein
MTKIMWYNVFYVNEYILLGLVDVTASSHI